MAEKSEKLGLLLLFDCIAVILSTYGVLLLFQFVSHDVDTNVMIVSCFFAGIKILMMGIGDITGLSKKLVIAIVFIVVADIIVFGINYFMAFSISSKLLLITAVADIVVILISHLIWGKVFGVSGHSEKRNEKNGSATVMKTRTKKNMTTFLSLWLQKTVTQMRLTLRP